MDKKKKTSEYNGDSCMTGWAKAKKEEEKTIKYYGDSCMTGWAKASIFSWSFGEHNTLLKACRTCIYNMLVSTHIWVWSRKIKKFVLQCINF